MKSSFQIFLIILFIAAAIFGVLVFSGAIPIGKDNSPGGLGTVTVWGTLKSSAIFNAVSDFNTANPSFVVKYVEKSADNFDQDLIEALATGTGPDMFFIPDDLAFHYTDKIAAIPYASYPLATFKTTFAGAGEVFLSSKGILAFPMAVDPLVMYYNRSILDSSNIVAPPTTWEELAKMVPDITKKDDSGKIIKSTVALGHFENVNHAKEILSTMFIQDGNPIVEVQNGVMQSVLGQTTAKYDPAPVLKFYTSFSDPSASVYSWNRSFPNSREAFSKEDLAFYFGFSSELAPLVNKNPNQNFLPAAVPQVKAGAQKSTGAHVTGLAVLAASKNVALSFTAANLMATGPFADKYREALGVAPARRDLLSVRQEDAYSPIFYNSALYARTWLDPSPVETNEIFRQMVEGVLSNSMTAADAVRNAGFKLGFLLFK